MSLCAIVPVANLVAANTELEEAGFGPGNFSKINANVWSPAAYPAGWELQP